MTKGGGVRWRFAAAVLALLAAAAGCGYRLENPPDLDEEVQVVVVGGDETLVRARTELQQAVAHELEVRLGWRISPAGSARLELTLERETVRATANDDRGIANRWRIRLKGHALLVSRRGHRAGSWQGDAYATGLADEPEALRTAAINGAGTLGAWLEKALRPESAGLPP